MFSTGRVREKRGVRGARRYLVDDWSEQTLPVNVFLIEHRDGLCLVDAGQTAAAAEPRYFPRWYPFFRLCRFELTSTEEAASQLAREGYDPRDVRWVVLTHLHTDHVGGLDAFRHVEVFVARDEWNRAQGLGGRLRGYVPQHWPPAIRPHVVEFNAPGVGPFRSAYNVTRDRSILFVSLPGHTPGHSAVLFDDGGCRYLCAGDAAHRATELRKTAPMVAEWCARENVTILTAHDDDADHAIARAGRARLARSAI